MSEQSGLGGELADAVGSTGPASAARPARSAPPAGGGPPGPPPGFFGPPQGPPPGPPPGGGPLPQQPPFNVPPPAPSGPTGPSLDPPAHSAVERADLLFFGLLAPVEATLTWSGQVWDVSIHVLTVEEENKLAAYVARQPQEQKVMAEMMLRMAYSLRSINDHPVVFEQPDEGAELRAKMEWVASWPATLLDAAVRTYAFASMQPVLRLEEMHDDPNSTAAPS